MKNLTVFCTAGALAALLLAAPASAGGDPDYRDHGKGYGYQSYKDGYAYHPRKPAYAPVYHYTGRTTYVTYPRVSTYSYTYTVPTYSYGYVGTAYPAYGYVYSGCRKVRRRWCGCRW